MHKKRLQLRSPLPQLEPFFEVSFMEKKKPSKPCGFKGFPVGARGGT